MFWRELKWWERFYQSVKINMTHSFFNLNVISFVLISSEQVDWSYAQHVVSDKSQNLKLYENCFFDSFWDADLSTSVIL